MHVFRWRKLKIIDQKLPNAGLIPSFEPATNIFDEFSVDWCERIGEIIQLNSVALTVCH